MKPPFAYYGGKTRMARAIVDLLPDHGHYVEPFAGSLAVLLEKPPSKLETVNDIDGHLMHFWRVLRDRPNELARAAYLTPHSRAELAAAYDLDCADELERARRVWVLLSQGRNGTLRSTGWRYFANVHGTSWSMPKYLEAYATRMLEAAERLRSVSLDCRDAFEVIADYGKHADALLYIDPPYSADTGRSLNYLHEMGDEPSHRRLASSVAGCKAAVVVSGYASPLYDELFGDWHQTRLRAWTGNGIGDGATKAAGNRTEVLWSNRPLNDGRLFGLDHLEAAHR